MTFIAPVSGMQPVRPAAAARRVAGFAVPERGADAANLVGAGEVSAAGLLGLQEAELPEVGERRARRHGQALLAELEALHRSLLAGRVAPERLRALAALADAMPDVPNAALQEALAGIVLRARVELVRVELARNSP